MLARQVVTLALGYQTALLSCCGGTIQNLSSQSYPSQVKTYFCDCPLTTILRVFFRISYVALGLYRHLRRAKSKTNALTMKVKGLRSSLLADLEFTNLGDRLLLLLRLRLLLGERDRDLKQSKMLQVKNTCFAIHNTIIC